jgi:hypothetical protein
MRPAKWRGKQSCWSPEMTKKLAGTQTRRCATGVVADQGRGSEGK